MIFVIVISYRNNISIMEVVDRCYQFVGVTYC